MKYIGNKTRLLEFIDESLMDFNIPSCGTFIDIFAGTASVAKYFKKKGYKIISNDFMTYSYFAQKVFIELNEMPSFKSLSNDGLCGVLTLLNNDKLVKEGYVFENYAPSGKFHRQYFSDDNAKRIDAIRDLIEDWKNKKLINDKEYYILVFILVDSADFVANISGTYGAYLKIWRSMALKEIRLNQVEIYDNKIDNETYNEDSNELIKRIIGNVLYIDPPYNERQYASNFHVLESLTVWDKQILNGKSGLRDYSKQKSRYCSKKTAYEALEDLIINSKVDYVALSYNNEGIISREQIIDLMKQFSKFKEYTMDYRRFRTERDNEKRHYNTIDDKVVEHLFVIKK